MSLSRRSTAVATVVAAVVAISGVAWAANLAVTSKSLGGAALATPAFFPSSMTTGNAKTSGRIEKNDTIQVVYNGVIQNTSICAGAPAGTLSAAGLTFTLTNGGAGNDTLAISGGTSCAALHFGSFLLGSGGYTTTSITYTACSISVVPAATTTTVTLTVGTGTNATTVSTATVVKYIPDPLMTDTSARAIGANTTSTTSAVQF